MTTPAALPAAPPLPRLTLLCMMSAILTVPLLLLEFSATLILLMDALHKVSPMEPELLTVAALQDTP